MDRAREKEKLVTPGDQICVIEEYMPGEGAFETREGVVVAKALGTVQLDKTRREARVRGIKERQEIGMGDIVLCEIKEIQEKLALVDILARNGKPLKHSRHGAILLPAGYRRHLSDVLGIGDVVFARVTLADSGVINLSIWSPSYGAVLCFCDNCASKLILVRGILTCEKCGQRERRKIIAKEYSQTQKIGEWLGLVV